MEQETKKSRYIQVNPSIEEMGAAASVSPDKVKNTVSEIISELKMHLVSHEKLLREIDKTTI
ncbi:MAG: hypothetical protein KKA07_09065, partial [Bacteroidetes bacterium]|nr:hypothetical protein [Bacteroidota bacterium]